MSAEVAALDTSAEAILAERERRRAYKLHQFFPALGPFARDHYAKHLEFFAAGATHKERLFCAANRVGKSEAGAYEVTLHATGLYPDWWPGKRFTEPVEVWAVGTNSQTTRDIVQAKLYGPLLAPRTGMIPAHLILQTTLARGGLSGSLESMAVQHVSGGTSIIGLKTYEQGRSSFEGTGKHVVWCDEEPPEDCYTEMLYRTITTRGLALVTFTPLQGLSNVVKGFIEPDDAARPFKHVTQAGWADVPHLDEDEKRAVLATTPPWQRDARTKGIPSLGAGAIYPIPESEFVVDDFAVPDEWPRAYALDVGWNRTAAVWGAISRPTKEAEGTVYLYAEHYRAEAEPAVHAAAIRGRGTWVPGVIDPASRGRTQKDGIALLDVYRELGLDLEPANHAVDAGLYAVWTLMSAGRLKVMRSLQAWLREYRMYRRDETGKIVKQDDHLMDATRYLVMTGRERAKVKPVPREEPRVLQFDQSAIGTGWMT